MSTAERRLRAALRKIQAGEEAIRDRDTAIGEMLAKGRSFEDLMDITGLSRRRMVEIASAQGQARPHGRPRKNAA